MRFASRPAAAVALAVALAVAACAGAGATRPLRPTDPAQAVEDAPGDAIADVGGVGVRVALDDWRGQPKDLEQRLTPVDVTIANRLDRPIQIGPEAFRLVPSSGTALRVLPQDEVARALRDLAGFRARPAPRVGAVGGPTFPGYDSPIPYGGRPGSPVPPPGQWYETQLPSGTLAPGRQTSLLLFFDTPARSLRAAELEIRLVDAAGAPVGTARLPFSRE